MSLEPSAWARDTVKRDRAIGYLLAVLLHGVLFIGVKTVFFQEARHGVESGFGGVEVTLVAALPAEAEAVQAAVVATQPDEPEEMIQEMPDPAPAPVAAPDSHAIGDGSEGGITEYKPGYLRNPAPRYPEAARRAGQEGLVKILARVNEKGLPVSVELLESSGYPLLDNAALKVVRRWKFEPARVGALAVESGVEIPIRFRLNEQGGS